MSTVGDPAPRPWPVAGSAVKLKNWLLTVRSDKVQMPDQSHVERTVVSHPGAVAVLAIDDGNRVLMIKQYRHPVGRELWEIPAGLRDAEGEPPLQTARRELLEEVGYTASEWYALIDYLTSPGFTDERIRIYLARGLTEVTNSDYEREHEEKFLVTAKVPLDEAVQLALAGRLHNGPAITAVLAGYAALRQGFSGLRPADAAEE